MLLTTCCQEWVTICWSCQEWFVFTNEFCEPLWFLDLGLNVQLKHFICCYFPDHFEKPTEGSINNFYNHQGWQNDCAFQFDNQTLIFCDLLQKKTALFHSFELSKIISVNCILSHYQTLIIITEQLFSYTIAKLLFLKYWVQNMTSS